MKTNNIFICAGALLLFASCETSRYATDGSTADAGTINPAMNTSTSPARNTGTTMNSTSPVSASAADPMLNTPAAVQSANSSATAGNVVHNSTTATATATYPQGNSPVASNASNPTHLADTNPTMGRKGTVITAPSNIETTFKTQFPNATDVQWYNYNSADVPIDWEMTGWPALTDKDYAVMYNVDTAPYYAWYDANGNWVGSSSRVSNHSTLPAPVMQLISSKYAGYNIMEVHAETYKNQSGYEIDLEKGTDKVKMVVDANGNILKQKTKTVGDDGKVMKEKIKN